MTSCFFFQKSEGDIHPEYPNILKKNDTSDFPLKPLATLNDRFIEIGESRYDLDSGEYIHEYEAIPYFERFKVNGQFVYQGGKGDLSIYYDRQGKLIRKSKYPTMNIYGQHFQYIEHEGSNEVTFYHFDFHTEKPVDTVRTVLYIASGNGYEIYHEDLMKRLPVLPKSHSVVPKREQYDADSLYQSALSEFFKDFVEVSKKYMQDLFSNNEASSFSGRYGFYYIFPELGVTITSDQWLGTKNLSEYDQSADTDRSGDPPAEASKDIRLVKTELVVHSLSNPGGRGNFLFAMAEKYMYYYDLTAEEDTLRFKSFRKLHMLDASKIDNKYIIVLGEAKYGDNNNYFFEYTPAKYQRNK